MEDDRAGGLGGSGNEPYNADFDLIARVTGQPTQWIVPPGTGP